MRILTKRETWTRVRLEPRRTFAPAPLTPEEIANVRTAVLWLQRRYGSAKKLATAMRSSASTVYRASAPRPSVTGTVVVKVARVAGVGVDEILRGEWPKAGSCPHCGRCG